MLQSVFSGFCYHAAQVTSRGNLGLESSPDTRKLYTSQYMQEVLRLAICTFCPSMALGDYMRV